MLGNIVGHPVEGDNFFNRVKEIDRLWRRLETDNILLLAPRRVGKTSVMWRLRGSAPDRGFAAVYLSVADVTSERAFIEKLFGAAHSMAPAKKTLAKLTKGPLGKLLRRIEKIDVGGVSFEFSSDSTERWAEVGGDLARALDAVEQRWLFLIDELPIFILHLLREDPTASRARTFLNWFRQLRQDPASSKRVRWLLAGSIGLDTVTRRERLSDTINDLYVESNIGAFERDVADAFLDALAKRYDLVLSPDIKARMCQHIGWLIPYHLQLYFSGLNDICADRSGGPSIAIVDEVHEEILRPSRRAYFDYWVQRLHEELGAPDDKQALALLAAVAKAPRGATLQVLKSELTRHLPLPAECDEKLRYLLDVLLSDGYLVEAGGTYRFLSPLLREFWVRRIAA
jgi:uncharacterized protein